MVLSRCDRVRRFGFDSDPAAWLKKRAGQDTRQQREAQTYQCTVEHTRHYEADAEIEVRLHVAAPAAPRRLRNATSINEQQSRFMPGPELNGMGATAKLNRVFWWKSTISIKRKRPGSPQGHRGLLSFSHYIIRVIVVRLSRKNAGNERTALPCGQPHDKAFGLCICRLTELRFSTALW